MEGHLLSASKPRSEPGVGELRRDQSGAERWAAPGGGPGSAAGPCRAGRPAVAPGSAQREQRREGYVGGRVVAALAQVVQRPAARRDQPGAARAAVGGGRRPGGSGRAADDRPGLHDRGGPRPGQAGRRVRLHQGPRLPPAARHVRPDRAGADEPAARRVRRRRPRRGVVPDRDPQPSPGRRRDRTGSPSGPTAPSTPRR